MSYACKCAVEVQELPCWILGQPAGHVEPRCNMLACLGGTGARYERARTFWWFLGGHAASFVKCTAAHTKPLVETTPFLLSATLYRRARGTFSVVFRRAARNRS